MMRFSRRLKNKKARELDKELLRLRRSARLLRRLKRLTNWFGNFFLASRRTCAKTPRGRPLKLGLHYHLNAEYAYHYSDKFDIPSVGNFTMLNFIAVVGHLHLLEWVLFNMDWKLPSFVINPLTTIYFNLRNKR